jgi:hypothetical protein
LAGWYIFDKSSGGTSHGLVAIASAKSGPMLFFVDFYPPMGSGKVIGDAFVDWWKGAVPHLEQPQEEDVFDHWPRKMQLKWDPVNLPGVRYTAEGDASHAVNAGK